MGKEEMFEDSQRAAHTQCKNMSTEAITKGNRTKAVVHLHCTFRAEHNGGSAANRRLVYRSTALAHADGRPYKLPPTLSVTDAVVHTAPVGATGGAKATLRELLGTGNRGLKSDGDGLNATSFSVGVARCKDAEGTGRYTGEVAVASLDKLLKPAAKQQELVDVDDLLDSTSAYALTDRQPAAEVDEAGGKHRYHPNGRTGGSAWEHATDVTKHDKHYTGSGESNAAKMYAHFTAGHAMADANAHVGRFVPHAEKLLAQNAKTLKVRWDSPSYELDSGGAEPDVVQKWPYLQLAIVVVSDGLRTQDGDGHSAHSDHETGKPLTHDVTLRVDLHTSRVDSHDEPAREETIPRPAHGHGSGKMYDPAFGW